MSTPKKPSTDLAALKARLAKKTTAGGSAPPPVPPMGGAVPPAPPMAPMSPPVAPPMPPTRAQPEMVAPPMAPPSPPASDPLGGSGEDPFGGASMSSFDPSAGVIDSGGEVSSRSNVGLLGFIFLIGAGFGVGVGWIGHKITEKREMLQRGQAKGEEMVKGVQAISDARASIALSMEGLVQKITADPAAAASEIEGLLKDKFDSQERIDSLFGWQLASVHANGVKSTFNLYEEASRLKTDLGYLAAFLANQPQALQSGGGPSNFAVEFKGDGAQLVAVVDALCGDSPAKAESCTDASAKPVAYSVVDAIGGEPRVLPRGTGTGQGMMIEREGAIYTYAIGMEPQKNAIVFRDQLIRRIGEHLEAMGKAEKTAQRALSNYADNPNIDGPAPDPGVE